MSIKWLKLIERKEFAVSAFSPDKVIDLVHVVTFSSNLDVYTSYRAQLASLLADNASTAFSSKYTNFADVSSPKSAVKLLEHIEIYDHPIDLVHGQQSSYIAIYSLMLIKLETLKTYIEINLVKNFILTFKSPAGAPIFFVSRPDSSFRLCFHYQELNNLTIKN